MALAIHKLARDDIGLVISGINEGPNRNGDIYVSGTVAAAFHAYLRCLPTIAISQDLGDTLHLDSAVYVTVLLAQFIFKYASQQFGY
jgi:5'/3'-nucleotidase SurE